MTVWPIKFMNANKQTFLIFSFIFNKMELQFAKKKAFKILIF